MPSTEFPAAVTEFVERVVASPHQDESVYMEIGRRVGKGGYSIQGLRMGGGWRGTIIPAHVGTTKMQGKREDTTNTWVLKLQQVRKSACTEFEVLEQLQGLPHTPELMREAACLRPACVELGGDMVFATRYCGVTLHHLATRDEGFTLQKLCDIIHQVAEHLCSAWKVAGAVHRDLHSKNVCVKHVDGGGDYRVHVIDWGCALKDRRSRAWPRGGDWNVCAPEMHGPPDKDGEFTPATDVFSLASTFLACALRKKIMYRTEDGSKFNLHSPCNYHRKDIKRWQPRSSEYVVRGFRALLLDCGIEEHDAGAYVRMLRRCVEPVQGERASMRDLQDMMQELGEELSTKYDIPLTGHRSARGSRSRRLKVRGTGRARVRKQP